MAAPLEGGTDWNAAIQRSREEIRSNRKALLILRQNIADAILLNKENEDLVVFLAGLTAQIDKIAAGTDEIGIALEELWQYGAHQKLKRKKERHNNDD